MSRKIIQGELTLNVFNQQLRRRKKAEVEVNVIGSKMIGKDACQKQDGMKTGLKESFHGTRKK